MQQVRVRVKGCIDSQWSEWLNDLTITHTDQGETVLAGPIADQAALYGLITKLRDLGLPLLSVDATSSGHRQLPDPHVGASVKN